MGDTRKVHTVLTALLVAGLRREIPELAVEDDAITDLDTELALLAEAERRGGEALVVRIGEAGAAMWDRPIHFFLGNTDSVRAIVEKVGLLQAAVHSQHRLQFEPTSEREMLVQHLRIDGAPPPRLASLFAAGATAAFLRGIGCQGLALDLPLLGHALIGRTVVAPPPGPGVHLWRIRWAGFVPRRKLQGLDEWLLGEMPSEPLPAGVVSAVIDVVDTDVRRAWTLARVAGMLGQSERGLQRQLAREGTSFSGLLWGRRLHCAARLLLGTEMTVAEIAEAAGFADGPHLTRRFRAVFGFAPSQWRQRRSAATLRQEGSDG